MKKLVRYFLSFLPASLQNALLGGFRHLRDQWKLMRAECYDWRQYRRHAGLFRRTAPGVVEARMHRAYHKIEKGLALPAPRPGFGNDAVKTILDEVGYYIQHFGPTPSTRHALNTLNEYVVFNNALGSDVAWLQPELGSLSERSPGNGHSGGTKLIKRDDILRASSLDLEQFFASRHSIRQSPPIQGKRRRYSRSRTAIVVSAIRRFKFSSSPRAWIHFSASRSASNAGLTVECSR